MNLVNIQKAIITDDLETAISGMLNLSKNSRLQNQVISVSGRYHSNERGNNMGTLTPDHYNRTRNQLRYVLQELIKEFPDYTQDIYEQANQALAAESSRSNTSTPREQITNGNSVFKILMLSSNPTHTAKLQLDTEYSSILKKILKQDKDKRYDIQIKEAVTLSGFSEALLDEEPDLVHFSGHGELNRETAIKNAISRGQGMMGSAIQKEESTGIILTSEDHRDNFFVPTSVIRGMFENMVGIHPIEAVVFNSCYSEAQAEAISELVPHVIGTSWSIKDEAAIAFATGFYSWLARRNDIELAWKNGRNMAMAYGEPKERFIYYKNGKKV